MSYSISLETVTDKQAALWPLLVQHREELTTHKDIMVLDPDWTKYAKLEELGMFFALLAWVEPEPSTLNGPTRKLIGYSGNFLGMNLHYKGLSQLQNDVLFIDPAHRASRIGLRLIEATRQLARDKGAKLLLWHAKPETALDHILPRQGCAVQDIIYSEVL